MNKKIILKILIIIFVIFCLSTRNVYAEDYDNDELTETYVEYTGPAIVVQPTPTPTPEDAPQNQIDNITYKDRTKIVGKIVESIEASDLQNLGGVQNNSVQDSSKNVYQKGVQGLKVDLYIDDEYVKSDSTSSNGEYEFSNLEKSGTHNYYLKYTYPNVSENDINNIHSIQEAKKIQEKLKLNGQDYQVISGSKTSTMEKYGKGIAQVMILLDCSISMKNTIVELPDGSNISKLELEKQIAINLVEDLLEYDKNIVIGLVVFTGQVYRKVSLTSNKQVLIDAIKSEIQFTKSGYTNVYGALDKAWKSFANNDRETSNRYIFLLSDGLPTSDGNSAHTLYKIPTGENEQKVRDINNQRLEIISENTSLKIQELENDGISIFAAISTEGLSESGLNRLNKIYRENKNPNYNYYEPVNSIQDIQGSLFVKNLKKYVKDSIKVIDSNYEINEATRGDNIKEAYKQFKYDNTLYFEALDMDIQNEEEIEIFKKYAKIILENTKVEVTTPKSTAMFKNETLPNPPQQEHYNEDGTLSYIEYFRLRDVVINAPISCIDKIPPFILEPKITATKATLLNSINNILKEKSLTPTSGESTEPDLSIEILEKEIYGGNLIVEYTVDLTNKSLFKNKINNIEFIAYLDTGFKFYKNGGLHAVIDDGTENKKELQIKAVELNKNIIQNYKNQKFLPSENVGKIEEYINKDKIAVLVKIENPNNYVIPTNATIKANFSGIKLMSGDEPDNGYSADAEIITYSNNAYRRLMYNIGTSSGLSDYNGTIAANKDESENDYAKSNQIVLTIPTGNDKSNTNIYIYLCILILLLSIIMLTKHIFM